MRTRSLCFRTLRVVVMACVLPAMLNAHQADTTGEHAPPRWYDLLQVNAFASAGYSWNANVPDAGKNQLRVFDQDDNNLTLHVLEIAFQKPAASPGEFGFTAHLAAGSSIPKAVRSAGLESGDIDVHQASIRYVADAGRGITIDAGKFVTPLGYEVIEGYDGFNDNATRGFLFGYAIPFTHTGLRVSYPLRDDVTGTVLIVNGWDNAVDNNRSKTVGGQIGVVPVQGVSLLAGALYGPEQTGNNSNNRTVVDLVGTFAVSPLLTLGVNGDYGMEEGTGPGGGTARWGGVAGYCRLHVLDRLSLALRGEYFEDTHGTRTGTVQKLQEVTLTPEFRPASGFIVRSDFRYDRSNAAVFEKRGAFQRSQFTITVNALVVF
jgi:hypothetical protein